MVVVFGQGNTHTLAHQRANNKHTNKWQRRKVREVEKEREGQSVSFTNVASGTKRWGLLLFFLRVSPHISPPPLLLLNIMHIPETMALSPIEMAHN